MRIDPARLFAPQSPSVAEQRATDLIKKHDFVDGVNQEYHTLFTSLFDTPSAWFFEHDGWLVGGVGGFTECKYYDNDNSHVFLCKDGVASLFQPEIFSKTVKGMRIDGLTDAGTFIDRLTNGVTPQHFIEGFSKRSCRTRPYLAQPTDGHFADLLVHHSVASFLGKDHPFEEDITSRVNGLGAFRHINLPRGNDYQAQSRAQVREELLNLLSSQVTTTSSVLRQGLNAAAVDAAKSAGSLNLRLVAWLSQGNAQRRTQALEANPGVLGGLVLEYWKPWVPRSRPSSMVEDFTDDAERLKNLQRGEAAYHTLIRQGMARVGQLIDEGQPWHGFTANWITRLHQAMGIHVDERYTQELLRGLQRIPRLPRERRPTLQACRSLSWLQLHTYDTQRTTLDVYTASPAAMLAWLCGVMEMADLPHSADQWAALRETMASAMAADAESLASKRELPEQSHGRSLAAFRRYRHTFKGVAQPPQGSDWLVPYAVLNTLGDARQDAAAWLQQAYQQSKRFIASVLHEAWTTKQWLDASAALHRFHHQATERQAALKAKAMAAFHQGSATGLWPAGEGLPTHSTLHDVAFTALLHPLSLLKEGEEMGHCVAGYSRACFSGQSRIYSMQHLQTQERATLELTLSTHVAPAEQAGRMATRRSSFAYPETRVAPQQLRGPHNQAVSEGMRQAAVALIAEVNAQDHVGGWPCLEVPAEWEGRQELDPLFFEQVRQWMNAKHPATARVLEGQTGA